jgi:hypothetical protein
MNPEEKAKELYNRFHSELPSFSDEGQLEHKLAKQCSLIAVDEMTNELGSLGHIQVRYWQEVRKEIERL